MTRRPLASSELDQALALAADRIHGACDWLASHGYVTRTGRQGQTMPRSAMTFWSLADKGRRWAKAQGALLVEQA